MNGFFVVKKGLPPARREYLSRRGQPSCLTRYDQPGGGVAAVTVIAFSAEALFAVESVAVILIL